MHWSRNRVSYKIDFKAVWPSNGHADSVGVKSRENCYFMLRFQQKMKSRIRRTLKIRLLLKMNKGRELPLRPVFWSLGMRNFSARVISRVFLNFIICNSKFHHFRQMPLTLHNPLCTNLSTTNFQNIVALKEVSSVWILLWSKPRKTLWFEFWSCRQIIEWKVENKI